MVAELKPPLTDQEALAEAYRCLECGGPEVPAPCQTACPADIDVAGFIAAISRGELERAAAVIFASNPLGGTCARVCPTEVLCEGACVLQALHQRPVDIGRLQRHATDWALAEPVPHPQARRTGARRVAIVGAGPAGLACAAGLASAGYRVTVYDERPEVGGLVRYAIAPYRIQAEPLPREMQRLEAMGVEFCLGSEFIPPEKLAAMGREVDAVFLAVGLGGDTPSSCPGSDLDGVYESLPFIEAIKLGKPPRLGQRVAVIGGGNTAIDVAREAVRLGASEVTLIYRRTESEMPAYQHEVAETKDEGVRFLWLMEPRRFLGAGHVEAVECQVMRLGDQDASGRRRPEPVPGELRTVPVDSVIQAIGQTPRVALLGEIPGLGLHRGRIVVDRESGRTGNPYYFAGGDAVNGGGTVVEAVRMGKAAAVGIDRALSGGAGR